MGVGDIYQLRWRTEQSGVVMNNGIFYRQFEEITGPTNPQGAANLLEVMSAARNGVTKWWQQAASDAAFITCAIVEKIVDASGTGDEQALDASLSWSGAGTQAAAPSQQWCFNLWANRVPTPGTIMRNLYIGGLDETVISNVGDWILSARANLMINNANWLLNPQVVIGLNPFEAVTPQRDVANGPILSWQRIVRVNPSFWVSRKNSRRLRVCV